MKDINVDCLDSLTQPFSTARKLCLWRNWNGEQIITFLDNPRFSFTLMFVQKQNLNIEEAVALFLITNLIRRLLIYVLGLLISLTYCSVNSGKKEASISYSIKLLFLFQFSNFNFIRLILLRYTWLHNCIHKLVH